MRFGGDDTCFLYNLTQNLRFDTLRPASTTGDDIPVYTSTSLAHPEQLDGFSNLSNDQEDQYDEDEEDSEINESVEVQSCPEDETSGVGGGRSKAMQNSSKARRMFKKKKSGAKRQQQMSFAEVDPSKLQLSFGETEMIISVRY